MTFQPIDADALVDVGGGLGGYKGHRVPMTHAELLAGLARADTRSFWKPWTWLIANRGEMAHRFKQSQPRSQAEQMIDW